jgi:hypothetical protein
MNPAEKYLTEKRREDTRKNWQKEERRNTISAISKLVTLVVGVPAAIIGAVRTYGSIEEPILPEEPIAIVEPANKEETTNPVTTDTAQPTPVPIPTKTYPNPLYTAKDNFAQDSDTMLLARAIYGEGRREVKKYPDYIKGVMASIFERAEDRGSSLREEILRTGKNEKGVTVHAYTCFSPADKNYDNIRNPDTKSWEKEAWEACYDLAKATLANKDAEGNPITPDGFDEVIGYYVGRKAGYDKKAVAKRRGIPSWAYKMNNEGYFILSGSKTRIPRKPAKEIPVGNQTAFFYTFKE